MTCDLKSLVRYNEDNDIERQRPWDYTPDTTTSEPQTQHLSESELDASVSHSQERCWMTAKNVIW